MCENSPTPTKVGSLPSRLVLRVKRMLVSGSIVITTVVISSVMLISGGTLRGTLILLQAGESCGFPPGSLAIALEAGSALLIGKDGKTYEWDFQQGDSKVMTYDYAFIKNPNPTPLHLEKVEQE